MNSLFRVSERNHLGLILMAELASKNEQETHVSLSRISTKMGVSLGYLEEIAQNLKQAGLIKGRKGPNGGYRLAQDPDKITAKKILAALEGPLILVECQRSNLQCPVANKCISKSFWNVLQTKLLTTLNETTLADMIR